MPSSPTWSFGPFRLDPANACLWQANRLVTLRPKPFAVLSYLVAHAGQLVTKEALFEAVWSETAVSDTVLKACIRQIRQALGDTAQTPQFIATVHRRGYRFLAPVTTAEPSSLPTTEATSPAKLDDLLESSLPSAPHHGFIVSRERELQQLHSWLGEARRGRRQVVFITGEPGVGKTTLLEALVEQAGVAPGAGLAWGQCVEHYGATEAYLPVLEALGQLCRGSEASQVVAVLRQRAPTWLVQMPWLLSPTDRELLRHELLGTTRERMLREFAAAIQALTRDQVLVLVLEDLHWSDHATLDLITFLAHQREPGRLLLVGSYRPVDAIVRGHPLLNVKQNLQLHGLCAELPLAPLSEAVVATYLATRLPGLTPPDGLVQQVFQRTDGNPLFMVNVIEHLVAQGTLVAGNGHWRLQEPIAGTDIGVPESLRQMIAQQLDRLTPDERRIVEVGSVRGIEFSAAVVAACLEAPLGDVEASCERLAQRGYILRPAHIVKWPDGTMTPYYAFRHALYQQVAYDQVGAASLVRLHRRIGERLEEGYGPQAQEIAAELAMHFVRGRDHKRAVQYLRQAAETAMQRHAHREAIEYLRQALDILQRLPETSERTRLELDVHLALGPALMVTKGFAEPEVESVYHRPRALCERLGETARLCPILFGLWRSHYVRAQVESARQLGEQLLSLAAGQQDPGLLIEAHGALGQTLCVQGELIPAREHLAQVRRLYNPRLHYPLALRYAYDPGVYAHAMQGWVLWLLGYPEQALRCGDEALALTWELSHPFTVSLTLAMVAVIQHMCRRGQSTQELAAASLAISTAQGFPYLQAVGTIVHGRGLVEQGQVEAGIAQMDRGLGASQAAGVKILRPISWRRRVGRPGTSTPG